ncbi:MAG: GNAT family N-acetyltransferase [Bacteroidota bacterium]
MHIRKAEPADVGIILHFIEAIADYEKLSDQVETTEEKLNQTLFGKKPFASVLLCYEGTTPVGFALYFYNYSTFRAKPGIYLEDLFVDPAYRGKGYGKALFQELIALANREHLGRLEWCVLNWNTPAIDFYKAMGATAMDEWTVYRITI